MQKTPSLWQKRKEEVNSLLMKVKEESKKAGLNLNIQKTKIMASGPITSCQMDGKTVETVADFLFLGSKITADGACSHEIKRCLFLGRKLMTNGKIIVLTRRTFVDKVMSLLFNMLSSGIPLQYSCLKNPMDGGGWWAAVHGVAKSRT